MIKTETPDGYVFLTPSECKVLSVNVNSEQCALGYYVGRSVVTLVSLSDFKISDDQVFMNHKMSDVDYVVSDISYDTWLKSDDRMSDVGTQCTVVIDFRFKNSTKCDECDDTNN